MNELPPVSPLVKFVRKTTPLSRAREFIAGLAPKKIVPTLAGPPKLRNSLGQGRLGACVGFAFTHFLNTNVVTWYSYGYDYAVDLWEWAKDHDGIAGNEDDPSGGTYVWVAQRKLRKEGIISTSPFIVNEKDLREHLLTIGPAVLSIPWYSGFDVPTQGNGSRGLIKLSGSVRGGHAILVYWFNQKTNRYWLQQSWTGYAPFDKYNQIVEMSASDMRKLLNRGGFALGPTKL